MRVVPKSDIEMIEWFRSRLAHWQSAEQQLGLSAEQLDQLQAALEQAEAYRASFEAAQIEARSAATGFHSSAGRLRHIGGPLINIIRANAEIAPDSGIVYQAARVPMPDAPTRSKRPPATPDCVKVAMVSSGAIRIKWKNRERRRGVFFRIERQVQPLSGPRGMWDAIASTGERSFVDHQAPRGVASVNYRIWPVRGGVTGSPSQPVTLLYGVAPHAPHNETARPLRAA